MAIASRRLVGLVKYWPDNFFANKTCRQAHCTHNLSAGVHSIHERLRKHHTTVCPKAILTSWSNQKSWPCKCAKLHGHMLWILLIGATFHLKFIQGRRVARTAYPRFGRINHPYCLTWEIAGVNTARRKWMLTIAESLQNPAPDHSKSDGCGPAVSCIRDWNVYLEFFLQAKTFLRPNFTARTTNIQTLGLKLTNLKTYNHNEWTEH